MSDHTKNYYKLSTKVACMHYNDKQKMQRGQSPNKYEKMLDISLIFQMIIETKLKQLYTLSPFKLARY